MQDPSTPQSKQLWAVLGISNSTTFLAIVSFAFELPESECQPALATKKLKKSTRKWVKPRMLHTHQTHNTALATAPFMLTPLCVSI